MRYLPMIPMLLAAAPLAAQTTEARVDAIFAPYTAPGQPGCALGIAQNGSMVLERAWGLADLERNVAITPGTIFEAGSVSKQFTAAAVLLLARDGKLTLDDDVRRWMPELPEYSTRVTLRNLLHHTSGLRDWGAISSVAGWGRDTRAINHNNVIQVIQKVRELNFPAGSEYDYSNSNYNLLAAIVARASGMSFPLFTKQRIFDPLGMTNTSWRDNASRVVPGRALSYNRQGQAGDWLTARAIENIYGNCCLLTTVGDLLKWMAAFDSTRLGGPGFREEQETRGVLTNGRQISYARGLEVDTWRGEPFVSHGGATAGYRAYTVRFPRRNLAVAVLCNAGTANPEALGDSAALVFMPLVAAAPAAPPAAAAVPPEAINDKAGLYRHTRTMAPQRLTVEGGRLQVQGGSELIPLGPAEFAAARGGNRALFSRRADGRFNLRIVQPNGDTIAIEAVDEPDTNAAARAQYVGTYYSDEANATFTVLDSAGAVRIHRAPDANAILRPAYRDGFTSAAGTVVFTRDGSGRVNGFLLTLPRVRNLRFVKRT